MSWKLKGRCAPAEVAAVIGDEPLERQIDLADQQPVAVELVQHLAHLGEHIRGCPA